MRCVVRVMQPTFYNLTYKFTMIKSHYLHNKNIIYLINQTLHTIIVLFSNIKICDKLTCCNQARQTRPNSGGVAEGHPRFDKGGVAIIFYFLRVKNFNFFEFLRKAIKKGLLLGSLRYKKVPFRNFFVKRLKKIHI